MRSVVFISDLSRLNCGAAYSLVDSAVAMKGHRMAVFLFKKGELGQKLESLGVKTFYGNSFFLDAPILSKLLININFFKFLFCFRPEITHFNSSERFYLGLNLISRCFFSKTLVHIREDFSGSIGQHLSLIFAHRILCVSYYVQKSIPSNYVKKSTVIYNPVIANIDTANRRYDLSDVEAPIIGYIGRISYEKGVDIFIEMIEKFSFNKKIVYKIAGFSNDFIKTNFESEIHNQLLEIKKRKNNVEILNWVDSDVFMKNIDILIVPTRVKEGLGRVAIEASSFGVPVITLSSGGILEVVTNGQNGFVVESLGDLHDKVNLLINNRDLYKDLSQGGLLIANQFTYMEFRDIYIDIIS